MNETLQSLTDRIKPCNTEEPYIFISYSSKDSVTVFRDVLEFQRRGFNVWIDVKNVDKTLSSWRDSAIEAISDYSCALLVFYVSENSLTSDPCFKEVIETWSQRTKSTHFGTVGLLCVDVNVINDITDKAAAIFTSIRKSSLSKDEKSSRTKVLSYFMDQVFNNNNERSRVLSIDNPGRTVNYYSEIIQSFPEETKIEEGEAVIEDKKEEKAEVKPQKDKAAAVKTADKPAEDKKDENAALKEKLLADAAAYPRFGKLSPNAIKTTYSNGNTYEGDVVNGQRNGYGILSFTSGAKYEGYHKDGKYCGKGIYIFADGRFYAGDFENSTYNGEGEYHYSNGAISKGQFKDGKREGHVVTTFDNGDLYEGEYFADKMNGAGKYTHASGSVYEGTYFNGKRSGYGVLKQSSGNSYEGYWKEGKYCGKGTYRFADGRYYKGDFANDTYNGHGEFHYTNGDLFVGEYKDGKREGEGLYTYASGNIISIGGNYSKGTITYGTTKYADGSILEGEYTDGKFTGKGSYEAHRDGKLVGKYSGSFVNKAYEGEGHFEFADGRIFDGYFVKNIPHGPGKYIVPAGITFDKEFFEKGFTYEGDFIAGKFAGTIFEFPHP